MFHPDTLLDVVERRARLEPSAPTFDGCSIAELRRGALAIATALRNRGLAGRAVLVAVPAGLDYVKSLLGCFYAGAIAVPAYPPTSNVLSRANERIASIIRDAEVRCALVASDDGGIPIEVLTVEAAIGDPGEPRFDWGLDADRACLLQYTSGSTSAPKGVAISLRQLTANLIAIRDATHASSADVLVTWLPPYHDMGLIGGIFAPLFIGIATFILPPEAFIRRPLRWLQAITERRATLTIAPNFAFDLCVKRIPPSRRAGLDLSTLRVVYNGAEPIHAATLDAFAEAFQAVGFDPRAFYPCYGLAEATLFVAGGDPDRVPVIARVDAAELEHHRVRDAEGEHSAVRLVGCGRPGVGGRLRIVDPDTRQSLPAGSVGEIWAAGPSVASGYWNRPEESAATFGARLAEGDDGPYLRTGDLGFLREGELFVTGRLKDLIIIRGQNHYPHDIERTVQRVHPALGAGVGAAFSVALHGVERLIVVHELDHRLGADTRQLLTAVLEAIRVEHGLAAAACVLVRRGAIERTASGKVQRRRTRTDYLEGKLSAVARWDAPEAPRPAAPLQAATEVAAAEPVGPALAGNNPRRRQAIVRFLRARMARLANITVDEVDDHAPLARYGIDSLHAAELTQELEQFLGDSLPVTISFDAPTIAALADALTAGTRADPEDAPAQLAPPVPQANDEPLAIVGMSCRFPGAPNLQRFWELLSRGEDAIAGIPAERPQLHGAGSDFGGFIDGIDRFDAEFFGISAREAARMDPQQRLLLESTWSALEDAGIPPSALRGSDAGVFAGVGTGEYALLHAGRPDLVDADSGVGHATSVIANRVSYLLDLRGPSLTVDTACSSSLVALHLAAQSLRARESSLAIVGGVNAVLAPEPGLFLSKARALAHDGRCKAFDARADGFVRSEGCGVIVLKRLRDALAANDRIYALVQGSAVNHDGASNGLMAPNGPAQERLIRRALARAGVRPDQVDYVEAHGVGAPLADAVELAALGRVFAGRRRSDPCWVGSVKTNVGHLEAAAGIAGVIKTALALAHERIPAHLHLGKVAEAIGLERLPLAIPTQPREWMRGARPRFAGVSAFGIGGANAHLLLREAPARAPRGEPRQRAQQLLVLSAKAPAALRQLAAQLAALVSDTRLADLCHSAATGRDHFAYRAAIVASDAASMREALQRIEAKAPRRREPRIAFLFDDGVPNLGAARELYACEPEFRRALDRGAVTAQGILDADLLPALLTDVPPPPRPLTPVNPDEPRIAYPQTSAVLLHFALHRLLEHWNIRPSLVYGSGVGEYSAASVAGVLGWQDALRLTARRELLLASLVPGGRVRQTLHQFKSALAALEYAPAQLPIVTSSRARALQAGETLDRAHWLEHLYARAEPARGWAELPALGAELYLPLAAGEDADLCRLSGLDPADWLASFGSPGGDQVALLQTLATLYERGCDPDWNAFYAGFERDRFPLPSYPFQHQRCWLDVPAAAPPASAPSPTTGAVRVHPFLSRARTALDPGRGAPRGSMR